MVDVLKPNWYNLNYNQQTIGLLEILDSMDSIFRDVELDAATEMTQWELEQIMKIISFLNSGDQIVGNGINLFLQHLFTWALIGQVIGCGAQW